ncbi:MAG: 30S ribosomal protein S18 [Chloroflexota bacterium]|nr:30S ribosomal protein S18 [Chloroflexota bacterium]
MADNQEEREGRSRPSRRPQRESSYTRHNRRFCEFCAEGIEHIDYKDIDLISKYVTESGRILGRSRTGTCAKHQRMLTRAVKRARHLAMLPYTAEHARGGGAYT